MSEQESPESQIQTEAVPSTAKWWHPLWEFLTHIVVGAGIFVLIATPAIALDALVTWLTGKGSGKVIVAGLRFSEYSLFVVDIMLCAYFLARTAWKTGRKL